MEEVRLSQPYQCVLTLRNILDLTHKISTVLKIDLISCQSVCNKYDEAVDVGADVGFGLPLLNVNMADSILNYD